MYHAHSLEIKSYTQTHTLMAARSASASAAFFLVSLLALRWSLSSTFWGDESMQTSPTLPAPHSRLVSLPAASLLYSATPGGMHYQHHKLAPGHTTEPLLQTFPAQNRLFQLCRWPSPDLDCTCEPGHSPSGQSGSSLQPMTVALWGHAHMMPAHSTEGGTLGSSPRLCCAFALLVYNTAFITLSCALAARPSL